MAKIKQFARIREHLCWERKGKTINIHDRSIGIAPDYNATITRPIVNFIEFERVLHEKSTNQDVFNQILEKLCDSVITRDDDQEETPTNSVFICYGQTASGKTHTILGGGGSGSTNLSLSGTARDEGVLQLSIEYLLKQMNVHSVSIQVMESYGKCYKDTAMFDVLNGEQIQTDLFQESGNQIQSSIHVFHANGDEIDDQFDDESDQRNVGKQIKDLLSTIRGNLHFGCTPRHNQSSRGHVIYILEIKLIESIDNYAVNGVLNEDDDTKHYSKRRLLLLDLGASASNFAFNKHFIENCSDPQIVKEWKQENKTMERGLRRLQKQIRNIASSDNTSGTKISNLSSTTSKCSKKSKSNRVHLRSMFYPILSLIQQNEEDLPRISILYTFSPSMTCIEESRLTLRSVHAMTGCRVYPERCCWKHTHDDHSNPTLKFQNAVHSVQMSLRTLKSMHIPKGRRESKDLKQIMEQVHLAIVAREPMDLVVDKHATQQWTAEDELQQERMLNITESDLKNKKERGSLSLYYTELQFAVDTALNIMDVNEKNEFDEAKIEEKRLSEMDRASIVRTSEIIQMEMESIRSAMRKSKVPLPSVMEKIVNDPVQRLSNAMGIQGMESIESIKSIPINDDEQEKEEQKEEEEKEMESKSSSSSITERANDIDEGSDENLEDLPYYYSFDNELDLESSPSYANDDYLKMEIVKLESYEKTLKETLNVLRDVPDYEECFPQEIRRIENQLKEVNEELIALGDQVNAFRNHTNDIKNALLIKKQKSLNSLSGREIEDIYDNEEWNGFDGINGMESINVESVGRNHGHSQGRYVEVGSDYMDDDEYYKRNNGDDRDGDGDQEMRYSRQQSTSKMKVCWKYFCWFWCQCRWCKREPAIVLENARGSLLQSQ